MKLSENIIKLRELTEKINTKDKDEYKKIIKKVKDIIADTKYKIDISSNQESKIFYYEYMCSTINNILSETKNL